jgi:hypothetical protein
MFLRIPKTDLLPENWQRIRFYLPKNLPQDWARKIADIAAEKAGYKLL